MKEIGDFIASQAKPGRAIRICICDDNGEITEVKWTAAGASCVKDQCCKKEETPK